MISPISGFIVLLVITNEINDIVTFCFCNTSDLSPGYNDEMSLLR